MTRPDALVSSENVDLVRAGDERGDVATRCAGSARTPRSPCRRRASSGSGVGELRDDLPRLGSRDGELERRLEVGLLEHREHAAGVGHLELRVEVDLAVDGVDEAVQALAGVRVAGSRRRRRARSRRRDRRARCASRRTPTRARSRAVQRDRAHVARDQVDERVGALGRGEAHDGPRSEDLGALVRSSATSYDCVSTIARRSCASMRVRFSPGTALLPWVRVGCRGLALLAPATTVPAYVSAHSPRVARDAACIGRMRGVQDGAGERRSSASDDGSGVETRRTGHGAVRIGRRGHPGRRARRGAGRRTTAILLAGFGGPEGAGRRHPVPAQRHARPRDPRRAARRGRAPLSALRRRQPDQRAEPRAEGRARGRARRAAGSTCRSTGATATGRRTSTTPCARPRQPATRTLLGAGDQRLLARSRAAASTARTSPRVLDRHGPRRRPCTIDKVRQFFDHPGFVAAVRRRGARPRSRSFLDGRASRAEPIRVLFSTHSIPIADAQRSGPRDVDFGDGRRVRRASIWPSARGVMARRRCATIPAAAEVRMGARLPVALRPAVAAVARARRLRRDRRAARPRASRPSSIVPLGFVERPHGGALGPRHRGDGGRGRGGHLRPCARRRPGVDPAYVAGLVDLDRGAAATARRRPSARTRPHLGPWFDVCRPGCCENVRAGIQARGRRPRALTRSVMGLRPEPPAR